MNTTSPITFSFGQNWQNFLASASADSVNAAMADIEKWLGHERIAGRSALDIGSGSGIHSLCIYKLEAKSLVSFDYDRHSVEATRKMWEMAGRPDNWKVDHGSVLDASFVDSLGKFDIVYSWGVLHHTGQMWNAIDLATRTVAPDGLFWIALYAKGPNYNRDLALKQRYNRSSVLGKKFLEWKWIGWLMARRLKHRKNPFAWNQRLPRGMDTYHDLVDWLGGLPYEVASKDETVAFCAERGLELLKAEEHAEGSCHVYLFRRAR